MESRATFGLWIALSILITANAGCLNVKSTGGSAEESGGEASPAAATPAAVGVGKQGRSLDNLEGVGGAIAQPARTLFDVKQRIVFDIQIPQALSFYSASNGKPSSHQQFMSEVIEANGIQLPELPEGRQYRFDVATQILMVEPKAN